MKKKFKYSLIISIILILLLGCGLFIVRYMLNMQMLSMVQKVRSDMRSISMALEAYRNDHQVYPPFTLDRSLSTWNNPPDINKTVPTFMFYRPGGSATITTPVNYITSYPHDPFSERGRHFAYYAPDGGKNGWVLFGPGPNLEFDLDWKSYSHDPTANWPTAESMNAMVNNIYDPTNGVVSNGDIVRFKQ